WYRPWIRRMRREDWDIGLAPEPAWRQSAAKCEPVDCGFECRAEPPSSGEAEPGPERLRAARCALPGRRSASWGLLRQIGPPAIEHAIDSRIMHPRRPPILGMRKGRPACLAVTVRGEEAQNCRHTLRWVGRKRGPRSGDGGQLPPGDSWRNATGTP